MIITSIDSLFFMLRSRFCMLFGVSQTDLDFVNCAVVIQALIASFKRILKMLEVLNFNFFIHMAPEYKYIFSFLFWNNIWEVSRSKQFLISSIWLKLRTCHLILGRLGKMVLTGRWIVKTQCVRCGGGRKSNYKSNFSARVDTAAAAAALITDKNLCAAAQ